jgi:hypothetical protein
MGGRRSRGDDLSESLDNYIYTTHTHTHIKTHTAVRPSSSPLPLDRIETRIAALFSIAADQARKMQQGNCKSIVALYHTHTLVQINLAPLVLTFVAKEERREDGRWMSLSLCVCSCVCVYLKVD